MPELQTELPLAVKQLLDITEDTPNDYEPDWKFETTQNNANKTREETNIVTKTPVAVQQHVISETQQVIQETFRCRILKTFETIFLI